MTSADPPRRSLLAVAGRGTIVIVLEFAAVTAAATCMHPHISGLNSRERQRDMLARADRQRLARQLRHLARASRHAERIGPRRRRAWRVFAAVTGLLPRYRAVR
ncbi:MAG TPA: hypothetical protein VKD66_01160 [Streptosporangiaceae bacterium]|nr:hypothetical protein [Streptosporangiaceae bacterium]